jgi:hypothetical protein
MTEQDDGNVSKKKKWTGLKGSFEKFLGTLVQISK